MNMKTYDVLVGNVGRVHSGKSRKKALEHFKEYRKQSRSGYGRAGGEDVVLLVDGEPSVEFFGTNSQPEILP